jgi:uncharacterized protein
MVPTMADDVDVIYRKYDGSLHWHLTMQWLGEDEHGVWTGLPPGGTMRKGDGPLITIAQAQVMLFPRDAWWTAVFNALPDPTEIYCDITTPVTWTTPREVTMIDLDLDVVRIRETAAVDLLDEDEFAEHQVKYNYPADVLDQATQAAVWLRTALTDGTEPFATAYLAQLALVLPNGADQPATIAPSVNPLSSRLLGRPVR